MEPWIIGVIVCCTIFATLAIQVIACMVFDSKPRGNINLSAETPEQKRLKTQYDLGFLCGKHDGNPGDYGKPSYAASDDRILHWWNGYHDGVKWREEGKKLNGESFNE